MRFKKNIKYVLAISLSFIIVTGILGSFSKIRGNEKIQPASIPQSPRPTLILPKDEPFKNYEIPKVEKKDEYTILLLGDSMTFALGPHGGIFNEKVNMRFDGDRPGILIDNYAQSSTNLLSVIEIMNKKIVNMDVTFEPMNTRKADVIMVESFGYNPLSQFPREEGLKIQTTALDEIMHLLTEKHPNAVIVFVATISPSKAFYGTNILNISATERINHAEERIEFIKNHIKYADSHNIPLVNIYEKSLMPDGDGNLEYINPDDYIHPSAVGIDYIGTELASFIYDSKLLPE